MNWCNNCSELELAGPFGARLVPNTRTPVGTTAIATIRVGGNRSCDTHDVSEEAIALAQQAIDDEQTQNPIQSQLDDFNVD